MENLIMSGTDHLPSIDFDAITGVFILKGRSLQGSDPQFIEIYDNIIEWLNKYAFYPAEKTSLNVQLEYYCTGTSRRLLDVFLILEKIYFSTKSVTVNWFFREDDPDMEESGKEYSQILKVPFNLILL